VFQGDDKIHVVNPSYQIDVLNGCGVRDVAYKVTMYLRERGFDVIDYGNFSRSDVERSFIVDHVNKPDTARLIARVLGIAGDRIFNSRRDYYNEFTVVIGKDYLRLKPFKK
jgi:hypothetical protein